MGAVIGPPDHVMAVSNPSLHTVKTETSVLVLPAELSESLVQWTGERGMLQTLTFSV